MKKKRHIPIISFSELELKQKKRQVYTSLIEGVSEALLKKKSEIKLCEVEHTDTYVTVHKDVWPDSLASALNFYIQKEEYEKCSKIKELINRL